jgi:hypothetical protein
MTGAPRVVLDACVLANFSLCDTLLRVAELFEPKWSDEIIRETTRTLEIETGLAVLAHHGNLAFLRRGVHNQGSLLFPLEYPQYISKL